MAAENDGFDHLDGSGRAVASVSRSPRLTVNLVTGGAILLSWLVLAAMASRSEMVGGPGTAAIGGWLFQFFPAIPLPAWFDAFLGLCLGPAPASGGLAGLAALTVMWLLMSVAMMLPSAAPLIRTYCEIADTARAKAEPVVHPMVLVAGYLSVWLAASLAFAVLSLAAGVATAGVLAPATGLFAAASVALAGAYQFTGLKNACLEKCRNPFATLFARWSAKPSKIYRLGLEQGIWCLGCCWALMLVMFAVGLMNVFWMALIALFTVVEKQIPSRLPSWIAGGIFLVWALALMFNLAASA